MRTRGSSSLPSSQLNLSPESSVAPSTGSSSSSHHKNTPASTLTGLSPRTTSQSTFNGNKRKSGKLMDPSTLKHSSHQEESLDDLQLKDHRSSIDKKRKRGSSSPLKESPQPDEDQFQKEFGKQELLHHLTLKEEEQNEQEQEQLKNDGKMLNSMQYSKVIGEAVIEMDSDSDVIITESMSLKPEFASQAVEQFDPEKQELTLQVIIESASDEDEEEEQEDQAESGKRNRSEPIEHQKKRKTSQIKKEEDTAAQIQGQTELLKEEDEEDEDDDDEGEFIILRGNLKNTRSSSMALSNTNDQKDNTPPVKLEVIYQGFSPSKSSSKEDSARFLNEPVYQKSLYTASSNKIESSTVTFKDETDDNEVAVKVLKRDPSAAFTKSNLSHLSSQPGSLPSSSCSTSSSYSSSLAAVSSPSFQSRSNTSFTTNSVDPFKNTTYSSAVRSMKNSAYNANNNSNRNSITSPPKQELSLMYHQLNHSSKNKSPLSNPQHLESQRLRSQSVSSNTSQSGPKTPSLNALSPSLASSANNNNPLTALIQYLKNPNSGATLNSVLYLLADMRRKEQTGQQSGVQDSSFVNTNGASSSSSPLNTSSTRKDKKSIRPASPGLQSSSSSDLLKATEDLTNLFNSPAALSAVAAALIAAKNLPRSSSGSNSMTPPTPPQSLSNSPILGYNNRDFSGVPPLNRSVVSSSNSSSADPQSSCIKRPDKPEAPPTMTLDDVLDTSRLSDLLHTEPQCSSSTSLNTDADLKRWSKIPVTSFRQTQTRPNRMTRSKKELKSALRKSFSKSSKKMNTTLCRMTRDWMSPDLKATMPTHTQSDSTVSMAGDTSPLSIGLSAGLEITIPTLSLGHVYDDLGILEMEIDVITKADDDKESDQ